MPRKTLVLTAAASDPKSWTRSAGRVSTSRPVSVRPSPCPTSATRCYIAPGIRAHQRHGYPGNGNMPAATMASSASRGAGCCVGLPAQSSRTRRLAGAPSPAVLRKPEPAASSDLWCQTIGTAAEFFMAGLTRTREVETLRSPIQRLVPSFRISCTSTRRRPSDFGTGHPAAYFHDEIIQVDVPDAARLPLSMRLMPAES